MLHTVVKGNDPARARQLLDKLDTLGIILPLDLLIVRERCVFLRVSGVQESRGVERVSILIAADVLYLDGVRLLDPVLIAHARFRVRIDGCVWLGAVERREEVDEVGWDSVCDGHGMLESDTD